MLYLLRSNLPSRLYCIVWECIEEWLPYSLLCNYLMCLRCIGKLGQNLENFYEGINSQHFPHAQTSLSAKIGSPQGTQAYNPPQTPTNTTTQPSQYRETPLHLTHSHLTPSKPLLYLHHTRTCIRTHMTRTCIHSTT